jgi:anti-sigma regulatory factor (Ser/Thr protein kinase)
MAPLPLSSVCAYDTRNLPDPLRPGIEQTHPALLTAGGRHAQRRLRRAGDGPPSHRDGWPGTLEVTTPVLRLDDLDDIGRLHALRAEVRVVLERSGPPQRLRADFAAGVTEVLANAFRHGRPPVSLRLWTTPTRLLCTVTDGGPGFDDPLAGYVAPADEPRRRVGLWLARPRRAKPFRPTGP